MAHAWLSCRSLLRTGWRLAAVMLGSRVIRATALAEVLHTFTGTREASCPG